MSRAREAEPELTGRETAQVERANVSSRTPAVFIHGLWALSSVWDQWAGYFEDAGYIALTPGWPDDPETVIEAREHPAVFAGKSVEQLVFHLEAVSARLGRKPIVVGHSFGGLLAQILAGRGRAAVSVAISPAPFRGVLPAPISMVRSALPVLRNPANRGRAVSLTYEQFRYSVANATDDQEAAKLHANYAVPAGGRALFQDALANINPWTEARVDSKNPARGPLLIISGGKDRFIPPAVTRSEYKRQRRSGAVTELVEFPGRGHSLTIDAGWPEVAETALRFIRRFE